MMVNKLKNNFGFTLIELVLVIAIIGILMLIATPSVIETLANTNKMAKDSHVAVVNSASKQYKAEYGERAENEAKLEEAEMTSLKKSKYKYNYDKETGAVSAN